MNIGKIIRAVPGQLTLDQLQTFYLDSCQIEFDQNCRKQVEQAAEMIQAAASGEDAIYGVNTGFGKLAHTRVSPGPDICIAEKPDLVPLLWCRARSTGTHSSFNHAAETVFFGERGFGCAVADTRIATGHAQCRHIADHSIKRLCRSLRGPGTACAYDSCHDW